MLLSVSWLVSSSLCCGCRQVQTHQQVNDIYKKWCPSYWSDVYLMVLSTIVSVHSYCKCLKCDRSAENLLCNLTVFETQTSQFNLLLPSSFWQLKVLQFHHFISACATNDCIKVSCCYSKANSVLFYVVGPEIYFVKVINPQETSTNCCNRLVSRGAWFANQPVRPLNNLTKLLFFKDIQTIMIKKNMKQIH